MMWHPMEVRDLIKCHGARYAYWELRKFGRFSVLESFYLIWVARGLK